MATSQVQEKNSDTGVRKHLITVDKYYQMVDAGIISPQEHIELINGEIYTMSPMNPFHAATIRKIRAYFSKVFIDAYTIGSQEPIEILANSVPEPDIFIATIKKDFYAQNHPQNEDVILVVEVSDSTYSFDKNVKASMYAKGKIPEYWIVNINNRKIEVLSDPEEDIYSQIRIYGVDEQIESKKLNKIFNVSDLLVGKN